MANSKAIELKGIVRNQTKIGVQDGQCDDIVNLKFKDGSWRVSADGKVIENGVGDAFSVSPYTQLYVHTNVYHHLLGVANGKLWWFANIDADNETFSYVTDNEGDPDAIEICDVQGDVTIAQNGHLLTIISTASSVTTPLPLATSTEDVIKYAIFNTSTNEYKVLKVDQNGEHTDRGLNPFGRVHFNTVSSDSDEYSVSVKEWGDATFETPYETNSYAIEKLAEKGLVSMPFLAIAAIKDYDGNYILASNPQYIFPKEKFYYLQEEGKSIAITYKSTGESYDGKSLVKIDKVGICDWSNAQKDENAEGALVIDCDKNPSYFQELSGAIPPMNIQMNTASLIGKYETVDRYYFGSKLTLSIDNFDFIIDNNDVFKSLCIFVTRQVNVFPNSFDDLSEVGKDYDTGEQYVIKKNNIYGYCSYKNVRSKKYVIDNLINSPLYLLREYDNSSILELKNNPIINLGDPEYKDVLRPDVLIQRDTIGGIAFDRKSFSPQVAYMYNQKLHVANYKTTQFHGYPIDCFQLSNHSVKVKNGSYAVGGVLPNLEDGSDVQYSRSKHPFLDHSSLLYDQYIQVSKDKGYCFAYVRVLIETQQGDQQVVRYIQPYDAHKFTNGDNANFVESLGALLTFPDHRAKEMEIAVISLHEGRVYRRSKTFNLTPHQYLNIAYYIDPQLKPIDLPVVGSSTGVDFNDFLTNSQIGLFVTPSERNNTEDYPNGLKVSLTNNPFTFPYESTYQIGSSEIVALMSNAVAVGTGQTGAAPLYVFCKDGIYALLVDSTGEMTYTNARIIARDVCNNAKSVTPIDDGVVFTTDRGLMSIAGSEVLELGAAAEGDVFDITDTSDKAKKIMFNAFKMDKLGSLQQELLDNADFLTFLKESIVNYDHNDRELMVSNPNYDYTYVMDRNSQWSRRDIKAVAYVNNYPTSYRVTEDGKLYKVDVEENVRGNCYLLSNVIKLGTISFKQAYRLAVRGYFDVRYTKRLKGSINGAVVYALGSYVDNMDPTRTINIRYVQKYGMYTWEDVDNGTTLSTALYIYDEETNKDVTDTIAQVDGQIFQLVADDESYSLGCYVFGSYDGRKWALLGGNEKKGKFTDIGCNISHTDMKYLRLCLAGQLSKDSRIDFIEIESDGSVLNNKLR